MENEILTLIDRYWKFDNDQTPVSNWHDKQDLLEAVRKALRIHDVKKSVCDNCVEMYKNANGNTGLPYCKECEKLKQNVL